ncbi:CLUMA_CG003025, isoform A [Clunio marinus]|uniref:CLUMA_CG003025, isoform A n=1 Tax=Clunio marinus TaxID=568069 RepID=A0A1J1HP09_9DIPT|nr:CLUMA_CG003025, isoform A [Clunio marinus]
MECALLKYHIQSTEATNVLGMRRFPTQKLITYLTTSDISLKRRVMLLLEWRINKSSNRLQDKNSSNATNGNLIS